MLDIRNFTVAGLRAEIDRRLEPTKKELVAFEFTRKHAPDGNEYTCCGSIIKEDWPPDVLLGIAKMAIKDGKDAGERMDGYVRMMGTRP